MKNFFSCLTLFMMVLTIQSYGQSIVGKWQLIKESTCMEDELSADIVDDTMVSEMKSMSSPTPQIILFKEKGSGEESTRILNKRRNTNQKNFMYRLNDNLLLILDKRTQTLTETFSVDKLSSDSLILSNSSRPCDTKIFLKIKDRK